VAEIRHVGYGGAIGFVMDKKEEITIVGGGLAGSEAAWQLADRGYRVRLYEMRPEVQTGAHKSGLLGEVVCSNSFKSTLVDNASGLLKAEMDVLGCRLLGVARDTTVPAGHALALDRELFAQAVTRAIESHPNIVLESRRRWTATPSTPAPVSGPAVTTKAKRTT
jgi:methylenetetrahydrofolate--tRNA-(uracil-5-)-methyltransferase